MERADIIVVYCEGRVAMIFDPYGMRKRLRDQLIEIRWN